MNSTERVLFLHGLHSRPEGDPSLRYAVFNLSRAGLKHRILKSAYEHVECVDMRKYIRSTRQKATAVVLFAFVPPVLVFCFTGSILFSFVAAAIDALLTVVALKRLIRGVLRKCIRLQHEAILRFKPTVIVGTSWGGGSTAHRTQLHSTTQQPTQHFTQLHSTTQQPTQHCIT
jgi:hypothetical protein